MTIPLVRAKDGKVKLHEYQANILEGDVHDFITSFMLIIKKSYFHGRPAIIPILCVCFESVHEFETRNAPRQRDSK